MTQIALIDTAIVDLLESCALPSPTVQSSPHEWDNGFIQRLLTMTPAVLVSWAGAEPFGDTSTTLQLLGKWSVTVATGWHGADQKAQPRGGRPDLAGSPCRSGFTELRRALNVFALEHHEAIRRIAPLGELPRGLSGMKPANESEQSPVALGQTPNVEVRPVRFHVHHVVNRQRQMLGRQV